MRILFILLAAVSINALAADATPSTTQDQATQVPQCYNGDDSKFYKVGEKATISWVQLVCEATTSALFESAQLLCICPLENETQSGSFEAMGNVPDDLKEAV